MSSRDQRAKIAQETVEIQQRGTYQSPSQNLISIQADQMAAQTQTILYKPDDFEPLALKVQKTWDKMPLYDTQFEIQNETTLQAAQRLVQEEKVSPVLALNFASAKNPGGGFLGGSLAQEESLAKASGLYACLLEKKEMYQINKQFKSLLYTDHMIYSPQVPVFRDDDDKLLEQPYLLSILTAPAVNAGWYLKKEKGGTEKVEQTMLARMEKLLWVCLAHHYPTLILGAWGCGVFQNDPQKIAQYFAQHLLSEGLFHRRFQRIVFAVLDNTKSQNTFNAFKQKFQ